MIHLEASRNPATIWSWCSFGRQRERERVRIVKSAKTRVGPERGLARMIL